MTIIKPVFTLPEEYRQLALDIDLEDVESVGVSAEDAKRRSATGLQALKGRNVKDAPWLDTFYQLLDGGWAWRQAAYIAWASTPREGRVPDTQDALARDYLALTSDRSIASWRKKNPAILEMIAILQSAPLWEQRADHFRALNDGANKAGDDYKFFNHLKLVMEMRRDYVPASQITADLRRKASGDFSDLSDAELDALELALKEKREAAVATDSVSDATDENEASE